MLFTSLTNLSSVVAGVGVYLALIPAAINGVQAVQDFNDSTTTKAAQVLYASDTGVQNASVETMTAGGNTHYLDLAVRGQARAKAAAVIDGLTASLQPDQFAWRQQADGSWVSPVSAATCDPQALATAYPGGSCYQVSGQWYLSLTSV